MSNKFKKPKREFIEKLALLAAESDHLIMIIPRVTDCGLEISVFNHGDNNLLELALRQVLLQQFSNTPLDQILFELMDGVKADMKEQQTNLNKHIAKIREKMH